MASAEPCGYLEKRTFVGIKQALQHRGGLRCCVVNAGEVRVGDRIEPAAIARPA